MLNKKGESTSYLGGRTISIIVGVIVIFLILIPLGVKLWAAVGNKEVKQAEESMKLIADAINAAKESGKSEALLLNPVNWRILAFYPGQEETPDKCGIELNSCVCICDTSDYNAGYDDRQYVAEDCNKRGVCKGFNNVVINNPSIPVNDDVISLQTVPRNLGFEKINDVINIYWKD